MSGLYCLSFFAVLGIYCATGLSEEEIQGIYECICSRGSELQDGYKECKEVKPKSIQAKVKTCRKELLLDSEDMGTVWENICHDVEHNPMKLSNCVLHSDMYKTACVKNMHDKHCMK